MKYAKPTPATKRMKGFTLIELVMVIVILGILAAVALPRFYDMGTNARTASIQGIYGAVNSAVAVAHSAALIQGATGATGTVVLEGTTVNLVYGYPAATATGIGAAVNIGSLASGNGSVTQTANAAATPPTYTYAVSGGSGTCNMVYTQATAAAAGSAGTPTVTGC
jgi:MSHA pilin protein MshA